MTIEDLEKYLKVLQPLFIIIAATIGGAWAIFRFWKFRELEKAKAELSLLKESLSKKGELNIELNSYEITSNLDIKHLINVEVKIENFGNKSETLLWKNGLVRYAKVNEVLNSKITFGTWKSVKIHGWDEERRASIISSGQSSIFNFLLPIDIAGLYCVEFEVPGSPDTNDRHMTEAHTVIDTSHLVGVWSVDKFINVP